MISKKEIESCIKAFLEKVTSANKEKIEELSNPEILPSRYIIQEIKEYPGKICYPKSLDPNDYEFVGINDNEMIIFVNLWFDGKKSDLIAALHVKKEKGKLSFYIQEIRVF